MNALAENSGSDSDERLIGTMELNTAKLILRDDATPKLCKARSVPYSLRPKVEAEIDRLQDTGI